MISEIQWNIYIKALWWEDTHCTVNLFSRDIDGEDEESREEEMEWQWGDSYMEMGEAFKF